MGNRGGGAGQEHRGKGRARCGKLGGRENTEEKVTEITPRNRGVLEATCSPVVPVEQQPVHSLQLVFPEVIVRFVRPCQLQFLPCVSRRPLLGQGKGTDESN